MSAPQQTTEPLIARRYIISGHVQGVGFRPFVYLLAQQNNIQGWVGNGMGQVIIHAEATSAVLDSFTNNLIQDAPPASRPLLKKTQDIACESITTFTIRESDPEAQVDIHIVADLPLCEHCQQEMHDPSNRRYRYPFINCTRCGPRYSLIKKLPYDRSNTSMSDFALCDACQREYNDPADRRFHAEPVACEDCGPSLSYTDKNHAITGNEQALQACVKALRAGAIVAVKGIGGYHLMCDACNETAVSTLRERKNRPDKPLAVIMPETSLDDFVECNNVALTLLKSISHPIILLPKKNNCALASNIAAGLNEIGVMLPDSPLHELILNDFAAPLVATSANISGEPILIDNNDVTHRLGHVAEAFLHHTRDIQRPADDPVYRIIDNKPRPIRLGRGNAPTELSLPFKLETPVLATGGHMKNTVALAWDDRIVISPHIGDLDTLRSQQVFAQVIADLQALYHVEAKTVICDAHPRYASSRWSRESGHPVIQVQHHHAHAAVLCGENTVEDHWLAFTWDGVGLGTDQTSWGGEALLGYAGNWQRVASMRPFNLTGGDISARQPWRSAASLCWETGKHWQPDIDGIKLLHQAWQHDLNCTQSSSAGRLFDAAAAILGLIETASYEGQAPMQLESIASKITTKTMAIELALQQDANKLWRSDWSELLSMLLDTQLSISERAYCFHESMALALLSQAKKIRQQHGDFCIGLCGGVFQNKLLTERVTQLLDESGFRYTIPLNVPVNDAGLCYGQVIEAMMPIGKP